MVPIYSLLYLIYKNNTNSSQLSHLCEHRNEIRIIDYFQFHNYLFFYFLLSSEMATKDSAAEDQMSSRDDDESGDHDDLKAGSSLNGASQR